MSDELSTDDIIKLADAMEMLLLAVTPDNAKHGKVRLTKKERETFEALRELKRRALAKKGCLPAPAHEESER